MVRYYVIRPLVTMIYKKNHHLLTHVKTNQSFMYTKKTFCLLTLIKYSFHSNNHLSPGQVTSMYSIQNIMLIWGEPWLTNHRKLCGKRCHRKEGHLCIYLGLIDVKLSLTNRIETNCKVFIMDFSPFLYDSGWFSLWFHCWLSVDSFNTS